MSNREDWERENSLTPGCAVPLAVCCFVCAVVFFYVAVSRWLFVYPDSSWQLVISASAMGGFFLYGGIAIAWRLAKGKPIPHARKGGEPPPLIEVYHFLPKDEKDDKKEARRDDRRR